MRRKRGCPISQSGFSFHFDQLPEEAQSLICSKASIPFCPGHVLLAKVSRSCSAAVARLLQLDRVSITLELACADSAPELWTGIIHRFSQRRLECLRLWLLKYRHAVTTLIINTPDLGKDLVTGWHEAISALLQALAAGRSLPGGLPLQQLVLPAVGGTLPSTIKQALSACPQLRELQLDAGYACQERLQTGSYQRQLARALAQLTGLTSLKLDTGLFRYGTGPSGPNLDTLCAVLPDSLVTLDLVKRSGPASPASPVRPHLHTSSLQHLSGLKKLTLGEDMQYFMQSTPVNPLTALTALTSLRFARGWEQQIDTRFLDLPNLVELHAGRVGWPELQLLSDCSALRVLSIQLAWYDSTGEAVIALAQLTQLTSLQVAFLGGDEDDLNWEPSAYLVKDWAEVLQELTGLHCLGVEPEMLQHIDFGPFTSLTHLKLDLSRARVDPSRTTMPALLKGLAAIRGQLREVELTRARTSRHRQWRLAVAAAVGDVALTFVNSWSN